MHNKILSIISACFACWISDRTSPSWGHPNLLCPWKCLLHFFLLGPRSLDYGVVICVFVLEILKNKVFSYYVLNFT